MINTFQKVCKICQKPLNKGKKYCSLECYWKKSPKLKKKCKLCGKYFFTYPSWIKNGEGFLCSKECKYKWISIKYRGKNSKAGYKGGKVKRKCKECKKIFYVFPYKVKYNRGIFCCKDCYTRWYRKNGKKENTPRWIDGRSYLPYPPEFNRKLKRRIKERDDYICQYCGSTKKLSIHHKDYDKFNNNEDNLITACMSCNSKLGDKLTNVKDNGFWPLRIRRKACL